MHEYSFDQPPSEPAPESEWVDRPGCVTAYAILLWIGAAFYVVSGLLLMFSGVAITDELAGFGICVGIVIIAISAFPIATGIGLWKMKKWGWWLVVISLSFGIISGVLSLLSSILGIAGGGAADIAPTACGALIGLVISGLILYWFYDNRSQFGFKGDYEIVTGPDGVKTTVPVEKKSSEGTVIIAIVVGGAAVLCLVAIVVIAILAILGPQIGNVFSQITYVLDNPPPA
jgi:hypothetical protein